MTKLFLLGILFAVGCGERRDAYEIMSPVAQVLEFGSGRALGSATAIGPHRLLTNAHVVRGRLGVVVRCFLWNEEKTRIVGSTDVLAVVIRLSVAEDLALLDIPRVCVLPYAQIGTEENLRIFDRVVAAGAGFGREVQPYDGAVTDQQDGRHIQISCETVPGCSGGGAFRFERGRWRLLGIVCMGYLGSEMSYIIPVSRIVKFLEKDVGG